MKNNFFFLIQSIFKYFPFKLGIYLRRIFYKPFFKSFGNQIKILDNVLIKYPNEIDFGNNITINQACIIVGKGGLKIDNNVLIGAGCKIITSSHNFENLDTPIINQGLSFKKIQIEDNVWFGFDVKVLGDVKISSGTVCSTSSVVLSGEYPKNVILGGIPAKIIKVRK